MQDSEKRLLGTGLYRQKRSHLQKQSFHRNLFMRDNFTKAKYFSKFECFQERKRIEDINKQEKEMLETTKQ